MSALPPLSPIRMSYRDLLSDPISLVLPVAQAFGADPGCLGIILIDSQPSSFTSNVLPSHSRLAQAFRPSSLSYVNVSSSSLMRLPTFPKLCGRVCRDRKACTRLDGVMGKS